MKTGLLFISLIVAVFMTWLGDQVQPALTVADLPPASAGAAEKMVATEAPVEESVEETPLQRPHFAGEPASAKLSVGTALYLETTFCNDNLCGDGDWRRWIIADADSAWTAEELGMIRHVLQNTLGALEELGIDGQELLDGYRFRRFKGEYVDNKPGRVALIVHSQMEITVSDTAFVRQRGFYIFHEVGHAVDRRLGRQFSDRFQRLATDDYKLRRQAQQDREEATADAFAVWVMVEYMGERRPVFHKTPVTADYTGISQAVEESLVSVRTFQPD
ncbi:MAG TPA: hypothetical protein VF177_04400 [Anaerolineae bacterium]